MKVAVACGSVGGLSSLEAGNIIARAWSDLGCEIALVPLAVGGDEFCEYLSDFENLAQITAAKKVGNRSEVTGLAADLQQIINNSSANKLYFDLSQVHCDDCSRELLQELGGIKKLTQLREKLTGRELIGLVDWDQEIRPFTGLRGIASTQGLEKGTDLAQILARDKEASQFLQDLSLEDGPGAGAAGGIGAVIMALGGTIRSALHYLIEISGLADTFKQADLIVASCQQMDFGSMGGPIMLEVIRLAQTAARPLIVFTEVNYVSKRELRDVGIETVYAVSGKLDVKANEKQLNSMKTDDLAKLATRVANSWYW